MATSRNDFLSSLKKIKKDRVHGSTFIVLKCLEILEQEITKHHEKNEEDIINKAINALDDAHEEMIEFKNVLRRLREDPTMKTLQTVRNEYLEAKDRVARNLSEELINMDARRVLTISHSSLVEHGLTYWSNSNPAHQQEDFNIHVLESRPLNEGRLLIKRLRTSAKGVKFFYWVDSAMGLALNRVDCVLLGVDRMYSDGCIVNKIGSFPLAVVAKEKDVPVLAVGTSFKRDVSACPHSHEKYQGFPRSPTEVVDNDFIFTTGVNVLNMYFELVPSQYLTKIITEQSFN